MDEEKRAELLHAIIKDGTSYDDAAMEQLKDCGKSGIEMLAKFADSGPYSGRCSLCAAVALAEIGGPARRIVLEKIAAEAKLWSETPWWGRQIHGNSDLEHRRQFLHALFENPELFRELTAEQRETIRTVQGLCKKYPALNYRGPGRAKLLPVLDRVIDSK
jgi:hypothetical protein